METILWHEHINLVNTYHHMYTSHDKSQQQYQQVSKLLKEYSGEIQHLQKELILTRLRPRKTYLSKCKTNNLSTFIQLSPYLFFISKSKLSLIYNSDTLLFSQLWNQSLAKIRYCLQSLEINHIWRSKVQMDGIGSS